jgi:hypothetical protein
LSRTFIIRYFENNNYKKFERKIHHNPNILQYYEKIIKKDGTVSRETYLIKEETYHIFIALINQIKCEFTPIDSKEIEELKIIQHDKQIKLSELKLQHLQIELEMKKVELELQKYNSVNDDDIKDDQTEEIYSDSDSSDTDEEIQEPNYVKHRINGAKIPKIYQYNPDDLKNPINIYDSPSELERKLNYISLPALKRASQNNTIYKNYRWLYVKRVEQPPEQISDTIVTKFKSPEIRFIAMIDIKKLKY